MRWPLTCHAVFLLGWCGLPRNWHELLEWLPDDGACLRFLERLREREERYDLRRHSHAADELVCRGVVGGQPEAGRGRAGAAARPGARQLPHRMDVAAQAAPRDGPSRAPTRAPSATTSSTTTSTRSPSASTAANLATAGCCSTASWKVRSQPSHPLQGAHQ
jgi:hypothetical protein